MNQDPVETAELAAFVNVVQEGSVAGASRALNLPRATVSRRLSRLEERLEVRLLHRTSRKQGLTDAGEELFRHARAILAAVDEATDALRQRDDRPRGLLRASLPPSEPNFRRVIADFVARYPEVTLEVEWSSRHVDLIAEGFDVALRAGSGSPDEGLIARRLASTRSTAWATCSYLEQRGTPSSPEQLVDHDCLLGFDRGVRPVTRWPLLDGGSVRVSGRLVSNDISLLAEACVRGLGIALLPEPFVRRLAEGAELVPVLESTVGAQGYISLVYAEREFLPAAVRAFVDHVADSHLVRAIDDFRAAPGRVGGRGA